MMVITMLNTKVTKISMEYAISIFDIAKEHQEIKLVEENLNALVNAINTNPDFIKLLDLKSISNDEKKNVIKSILNLEKENYFLYFLYVLIDNDRILELASITKAYHDLALEYSKEMVVDVYSKYNLTAQQINNLTSKLEKDFNKKIIMNLEIDQTIIGGIIVKTKDKIYDYTIDGQLENLKEKIMKG